MSLINQMLHDLDARTSAGGEAADLYTKPVARRDGTVSSKALAAAAAGMVALAVAGALAWRHYQKPAPVQGAQQPVKAVMLPRPAVTTTVASLPQQTGPVKAAPVEAPPAAEPVPDEAKAAPSKPAPKIRREAREAKLEPEKEKKARAAEPRPERVARAPKDNVAVPLTKAKAANPTPSQGREESAVQKAEGAYRNALARLQEGWVNDAIAALEQALQINPRHDAARQTLIGLLIENKRFDEAIRQLQAGLSLDPRQPAMAMLLARLQIERGGSGIETMMRSLPYASGNGEYQAFLAGALQRAQRHHEAAEQYQAALRSAPGNGVWWMGLGISLQADKRNAEALEAFGKAKGSGTLNQELLAFVERKIQQLNH